MGTQYYCHILQISKMILNLKIYGKYMDLKQRLTGAFLVVRRLILCAPTAGAQI